MNKPTMLHLRSVDHHNAPTEVRERAHLDPVKVVALMDALSGGKARDLQEHGSSATDCISAIPVSTCNRSEIYLEVREGTDPDQVLRQGLHTIQADVDLFFSKYAYSLDGLPAIEHLYRVASGIESMMLGETQISRQLKAAYRLAREHHEPGPCLLRAFQGAFRAGKRVRTETRISSGAVSVAFAAVELARRIFNRLSDQKAVLVGAGETGGLAARHFLQHDIGRLIVINRSLEKAKKLSDTLIAQTMASSDSELEPQEGPSPISIPEVDAIRGRISCQPWEDLPSVLSHADVILSTTGALEPVILPEMVERAISQRKGKPLFLLDIAVPRDIDPEVANIHGVYLFGLDDLHEIVHGNIEERKSQVPHAERIIQEELLEFQQWFDDVDLRPTVAEFKAYLEELKDKQVGFVRRKQSAEVAATVDSILQHFIKKLLGKSVSSLKNTDNRDERERDLDTLRRIFSMEDRDGS